MSDDTVLTTPPVHDAGPDIGQKEIEGGEVSRTGVDSRLRAAFEKAVDEVAERTSMPVVAPVKELLAATMRIISDMPRVPDYDHVSACATSWSETSEYNRYEVPETDPDSLGVFVRDQGPQFGMVCVELTRPGADVTTTLDFDPEYAESFFLAGLAACAYAKSKK